MNAEIQLRHQCGDHLHISLNVDDKQDFADKGRAIFDYFRDHAFAIRRFAAALGLEHDDIVINITHLVDNVGEVEVGTSSLEAMATVRYISASHEIDINVGHGRVSVDDPEALLKLLAHEMLHIAVSKVSGSVRLYAGDRRGRSKYDLADAMVDASHSAEEALVRKLTPLLWKELQ